MFKQRYAVLGFLTWKLGKRFVRRKLRAPFRSRSTLPLIAAGGAALAAGVAVVGWRMTRSNDAADARP